MKFTGKNLARLCRGIELALAEIHSQIGHMVKEDSTFYEEALDELEAEQAEFERLLARIEQTVKR